MKWTKFSTTMGSEFKQESKLFPLPSMIQPRLNHHAPHWQRSSAHEFHMEKHGNTILCYHRDGTAQRKDDIAFSLQLHSAC